MIKETSNTFGTALSSSRVWGVAAFLIILTSATFLRLFHLENPKRLVWDELYYVPAARVLAGLEKPSPLFQPADPILAKSPDANPQHPLLGKFLISLGVQQLPHRALGYRLVTLGFGLAGIITFFFLAFALFPDRKAAFLAFFLISFDFLHIVHSRIATLESFLFFFGVALYFSWIKLREKPASLGRQTMVGFFMAALFATKHIGALSGQGCCYSS